MIKKIVVGLIVLFTCNSFGQNTKILGDWKEIYHTKIDTLASGGELVKSNFRAYRDGVLILDKSYYDTTKIYPSEGWGFMIIKIKEDLGVLWFATWHKSDFVKKLFYDATKNKYLITKGDFTIPNLTIEYDEKTQHLQLIDEKNKIVMYEFSRN
jgi:hypothetical protein